MLDSRRVETFISILNVINLDESSENVSKYEQF